MKFAVALIDKIDPYNKPLKIGSIIEQRYLCVKGDSLIVINRNLYGYKDGCFYMVRVEPTTQEPLTHEEKKAGKRQRIYYNTVFPLDESEMSIMDESSDFSLDDDFQLD